MASTALPPFAEERDAESLQLGEGHAGRRSFEASQEIQPAIFDEWCH